MHTNWCVLIEISMEIGMLNFWLVLLVTALTKETYFNQKIASSIIFSKIRKNELLWEKKFAHQFGKIKENLRLTWAFHPIRFVNAINIISKSSQTTIERVRSLLWIKDILKFRYSEKGTKFEKNLIWHYLETSKRLGVFSKFRGLLRISELYEVA